MMILGHSFIVYPIDISQLSWCLTLHNWIYSFHMELFFVLSGAVYCRHEYRTMLKGKIRRLGIPYLFLGMAALLLHAFGGKLVNGTVPFQEGLRDLIFYGGGYWFIYVLFLIFAFYPLLEHVFCTTVSKMILVCVLIAVQCLDGIPEIFLLNGVVRYMPYFIIGQLAQPYLNAGRIFSEKKFDSLCVFSISLAVYLLLGYSSTTGFLLIVIGYIRALSMILCCSIFINFVLTQNGKLKEGILQKVGCFLEECSRYSLQLYLFNGYILAVMRILLCNILHIENAVLLVCGIWLANIVGTLVLCKYILPKIPIVAFLLGIKVKRK
ncbi:acyltransferase family protein [Owariibacterium komagatae]|uniref:acyltransferase family protein n=1 Tax=Owariibacterium komagatae TaxID=3136601 RepID=UPI0038B3725D